MARSERVGGCEWRGRGYGGQGAVRTSSSSSSGAAGLLSRSLILTGPANPEDSAPQGGGAAGGAAWRVTGRAGDRKTSGGRKKKKRSEKAKKIRDDQRKQVSSLTAREMLMPVKSAAIRGGSRFLCDKTKAASGWKCYPWKSEKKGLDAAQPNGRQWVSRRWKQEVEAGAKRPEDAA